jgi:ubiquinone biosynthesis protein
MRFVLYIPRFFVMAAVMWWFLVRYAVGRIGTWFVKAGEPRRKAVARLRGRSMRKAFAALGATFVKLGQVFSSRPDLFEPEIIDELRKLQDRMPPFAFAKARRILEEDLGKPMGELYAEIDEKPIAAASVAQVHRARLRDGTVVAVKILRPDVRHKVLRDAAILNALARLATIRPRWRLSDPVGHLKHFEKGIVEQTDLRLEAANYERFHANFAGTPGVRFPRIHAALCSQRVLTMDFVEGTKLDALAPGDYRALAERLQQAILKMCFVDAFVHADLHPGNLVLEPGGDLVIFDVGLVKHLGPELKVQFIDFARCLTLGTPVDFLAHLRRFHTYVGEVDWPSLSQDLEKFLGHFRAQTVGTMEIGSMFNEIYAMGRRYRLRPVAEMVLVMVGIVTAEGIGKQLNPENNLFQSVAAYLMPILAAGGGGPSVVEHR